MLNILLQVEDFALWYFGCFLKNVAGSQLLRRRGEPGPSPLITNDPDDCRGLRLTNPSSLECFCPKGSRNSELEGSLWGSPQVFYRRGNEHGSLGAPRMGPTSPCVQLPSHSSELSVWSGGVREQLFVTLGRLLTFLIPTWKVRSLVSVCRGCTRGLSWAALLPFLLHVQLGAVGVHVSLSCCSWGLRDSLPRGAGSGCFHEALTQCRQ